MNKAKIVNALISTIIVLFSILVSYFLVTNNVDIAKDIGWYIHLFFGDQKAYFFNIIPMVVWELVQLIKFFLLAASIAVLLFFVYNTIRKIIYNGRSLD